MSVVAVMQPYFIPYAGYFRLFSAADTVVMFDCVQFPRRGWVHRNRLHLASGELDWLTLPIAKCDRSTRIDELRFPVDAPERLDAALRRFPLAEAARLAKSPIIARLLDLAGSDVASYLVELAIYFGAMLGFNPKVVRSSSFGIPAELHAQERVIAIAEKCGATVYVNPPGGRQLYERGAFAAHGIDLRFLPDYERSSASILERVLTSGPSDVAAEIATRTSLER